MKPGYFCAWLVMLTLLATTCQAQPSRGDSRARGRSTRDTLFRLLDMPAVRKEIGLRPLQIEILADLQADLGEQRRAAFSTGDPLGLPDFPGRDSRDRFDAMRERIQNLRTQGEKLISVVLDANQNERLHQLRLQDEGTRALDRQEFREQLGVSDEQFEKIQTARRTEDDPSLSRRRRQKRVDDAVLGLLSQEQQAKFQEQQGEPFDFPLPLPADLRGLREPGR